MAIVRHRMIPIYLHGNNAMPVDHIDATGFFATAWADTQGANPTGRSTPDGTIEYAEPGVLLPTRQAAILYYLFQPDELEGIEEDDQYLFDDDHIDRIVLCDEKGD